ncbi:MAG: hypothetical protein AAF291_01190 [Pseudomonadota bacterium]
MADDDDDNDLQRVADPAQRMRRGNDDYAFWQEAEEAYSEDIARYEDEELAARRADAIEGMVGWFESQFEDPQVRTPSDGEGNFYFWNGGPFEAMDILDGNFSEDYEEDWIRAAADEVERGGVFEWAPKQGGAYFEPQDDDDAVNTTREDMLVQISALRQQLSELPVRPKNFGHNQPPEEIGAPPYDDDDRLEIETLLTETERELSSETPSIDKLTETRKGLSRFSEKALGYLGAKADLAIDEIIKKGVIAGAAYLAFGENLQKLVDGIADFLHNLPL